MKPFAYVAYTPDGRRRRGVVVAEDEAAASAAVAARGLLPADIRPERAAGAPRPALRRRGGRIDGDVLAVFTRQMAVLLGAGMAADAALDAVQQSATAPRLESFAARLRATLLQGDPLSQALMAAGRDLPPYYAAAVRAGEASGELAAVFETLATHLEAVSGDRMQIATALIYPAFVTVVAVLVCGVLMVTVAPEIVSMFAATGQELPAITRAMLGLVETIETRWPVLAATLAAGVAAAVAAARVPALRARRDAVLLRLPVTGRLMRQAAAAQYLRSLALVINSRLPLTEALAHAAGVLRVAAFSAAAEKAVEALRRGDTLARALAGLDFLPLMGRQLIEAGELSARLGPMSERAAALAEAALRSERRRLSLLLEPLAMVAVGGAVLVMVLAILLPIFDMQAMVGPG